MESLIPDARLTRTVSTRMVLDQSGRTWRIAEMMDSPNPGAPRAKCLVLSSENGYVRAWSYPNDWMHWSIDELLREVRKSRPVAPLQTPSLPSPSDLEVAKPLTSR